MKFTILIVSIIFWAIAPLGAFAQNNSVPTNATWLEQVKNYLNSQHNHSGYEVDPNFEDWIVPIDKRFARSKKVSNTYRLEEGTSYLVVGSCDNDCLDLDLQAFDSNGTSVAIDQLTDDRPILRITPITTDDFKIDMWWATCYNAPC